MEGKDEAVNGGDRKATVEKQLDVCQRMNQAVIDEKPFSLQEYQELSVAEIPYIPDPKLIFYSFATEWLRKIEGEVSGYFTLLPAVLGLQCAELKRRCCRKYTFIKQFSHHRSEQLDIIDRYYADLCLLSVAFDTFPPIYLRSVEERKMCENNVCIRENSANLSDDVKEALRLASDLYEKLNYENGRDMIRAVIEDIKESTTESEFQAICMKKHPEVAAVIEDWSKALEELRQKKQCRIRAMEVIKGRFACTSSKTLLDSMTKWVVGTRLRVRRPIHKWLKKNQEEMSFQLLDWLENLCQLNGMLITDVAVILCSVLGILCRCGTKSRSSVQSFLHRAPKTIVSHCSLRQFVPPLTVDDIVYERLKLVYHPGSIYLRTMIIAFLEVNEGADVPSKIINVLGNLRYFTYGVAFRLNGMNLVTFGRRIAKFNLVSLEEAFEMARTDETEASLNQVIPKILELERQQRNVWEWARTLNPDYFVALSDKANPVLIYQLAFILEPIPKDKRGSIWKMKFPFLFERVKEKCQWHALCLKHDLEEEAAHSSKNDDQGCSNSSQ